MAEAKWYVVHTYSGYENKVKANIEKTIENNKSLAEQILEVRVPMQDVVELKDGARKTVSKKMFPGYVLLNMEMNDDTWYVVRNTRGVTGCGNQLCRGQKALISLQGYFFSRAIPEIKYKTLRNRKVKRVAA